MERIKFSKHNIFISLITLFFFLLPFFWFKPGEMDLGGDSSRLYFYDPLAYLQNYAFYGISPSAFGAENIGYFMVPFVVLLFVLKYFFSSPTMLIAFFHGLSISIAFLATYGIVKNFLFDQDNKKGITNELASVISGLTYVLAPTSILGWDKVLITHNQFFLNPLIFYLLLKYFKTDKLSFIAFALILTFLFSPNFSFAAAPGFFAFYPLSLLFLFLYRLVILKKKIIWIHIFIASIGFIFLQAFHIVPQLISMLSPGSVLNTTIFSSAGKFDRGLSYFMAIAPNIKVSISLMNLPQMTELALFSSFFICFPVIITMGFLFNRNKTILLTGSFFLIVLFFATANITSVGFELYKKMFSLPGFSIFRNFFGQWGYALLFFYTILFAQAFAVILEKLSKRTMYLLAFGFIFILLFFAYPFINGSLVDKILWQSNGVHIFMKMDPKYEELLSFVRKLPENGKVLTLPLTDPGYQIVAGSNNGAYQGPSTISYLAGKQDFAGYEEFGQFKELLASLVKNKDYARIKKLLGLLNIKYIVYNSEPQVYEQGFPNFPYNDVRKSFPKTQKEYKLFLQELSLKQIKNIDNKYFVYEIESDFQPKIFTTQHAKLFTKAIDNWEIPLLFENQRKETVYFDTVQSSSHFDESFTSLDPHNLFTKVIKNPNPPHFLYNAFAKTSPTSPWYKLSVIKEYSNLNKQIDNYLYFDSRMFLSAKLIYGAELWGKEMALFKRSDSAEKAFNNIISETPQRSLIWELQNANNDWESLLTRYVKNFTESVDYIQKHNTDPQWVAEQKILMNEYLLNHKQRLNNTIASIQSEKDRLIVTQLVNKIFNNLSERVKVSDKSFIMNEYLIPQIDTKVELAELYMKKSDFSFFDQSQFGLEINKQELNISQDQDEPLWVKFNTDNIDFHKPEIITINLKKENNLMNNAELISLSSSSMNRETISTIQSGAIWKIHNWYPNGYYLLSFDYKTPETPYYLRFYEEVSKSTDVKELFKNPINSTVWTRYQAVVHSGTDAQAAIIQFERLSDLNPLAKFEIKNITLRYLPHPTLVLKTIYPQGHTVSPTISYTKINPTKYIISITNGRNPYYLVFNQAYNSRWKIYRVNSANPKTDDFTFLEKMRRNSLFDSVHYPVNGGMNAWYIDPKEFVNKDTYTFVLEFTTQWYFYVGLFISLITFCVVVLYTIFFLVRHEK